MKYTVIVEKGGSSHGAFVPDLPGCITAVSRLARITSVPPARGRRPTNGRPTFEGRRGAGSRRAGEDAARTSVALKGRFRRDPVFLVLVLRLGDPLDAVVGGRSAGARAHHGILPCIVLGPSVRQAADRPWGVDGGERVEGVTEDPPLERLVVRLPRRMPEREVQVHGAGRVDRRGDGKGARHADGRDPAAFDLSCDQSDGLMADRSGRDEHCGVGCVFLHALGERRSEDLSHLARRIDPPHERVGIRADRPDAAIVDLLA